MIRKLRTRNLNVMMYSHVWSYPAHLPHGLIITLEMICIARMLYQVLFF